LLLTKISFNTSGEITGGELINNSNSTVSDYHFGILLLKRNESEPQFVPGPAIRATGEIKPRDSRGIPGPLGLGNSVKSPEVFGVAVFISQVRFQDGSTWNANLEATIKRIEESLRHTRVNRTMARHARPASSLLRTALIREN
jgi:hypothetical protein